PRLALLQPLERALAEDVELGQLPEEVGLVVRQVAHHAPELLRALRAEPEISVVLLEGAEIEAHQAAREPRAKRGPLRVLEEQPETLVDEVPEEAELFLRQLRVMVGRPKHGPTCRTDLPQRTRRIAEDAENIGGAEVRFLYSFSFPLRPLRLSAPSAVKK